MPPAVAAVKERVETDLADARVTELINEAVEAIESRHGPWRSTETPPAAITVQLEGDRQTLSLARPIDTDEAVAIVEHVSASFSVEESTTLAANDWRSWHGGRTLQRLAMGTNPRTLWGQRVEVSYVPVDDTKQRDEVVIKLVQLSVEYQGVGERVTGDHRQVNADFTADRERLLSALAPRGRMGLA